MNISPSSRESIHALLDISLDTPKETAHVFFAHQAHVKSIDVRIYVGGWITDSHPDFLSSIYTDSDIVDALGAEGLLENVRAYLDPENLARVAEQKKADRVANLEQQLQEAKK